MSAFKMFWNRVEELLHAKCPTCKNIKFTEKLVLFGMDENIYSDTIFDHIILLGKMYVYKCKYEKVTPQIIPFQKYVNANYKIEEHNARLTWTLHNFNMKWSPYLPCFREDRA